MSARASSNGGRWELTLRYHFAASHRLHSHELSEPENDRVYGKCNNPFGHGHNYVVDVTVGGTPDAQSAMLVPREVLDGFVQREVLDAFDHRNLNEEVAEFRDTVPTTENLCIEIFRRLRAFPAARLVRVRIEETGNNAFEYSG